MSSHSRASGDGGAPPAGSWVWAAQRTRRPALGTRAARAELRRGGSRARAERPECAWLPPAAAAHRASSGSEPKGGRARKGGVPVPGRHRRQGGGRVSRTGGSTFKPSDSRLGQQDAAQGAAGHAAPSPWARAVPGRQTHRRLPAQRARPPPSPHGGTRGPQAGVSGGATPAARAPPPRDCEQACGGRGESARAARRRLPGPEQG